MLVYIVPLWDIWRFVALCVRSAESRNWPFTVTSLLSGREKVNSSKIIIHLPIFPT